MNIPLRITAHVAAATLAALVACSDDPPGSTTGSGGGGAGGSSSGMGGGAGSTSSGEGGIAMGSGGSASGTGGSAGGAGGAGGSGGGSSEIVIKNPGFEEDLVPAGQYNDKIVPSGWVKYDPDNIIGLDYNSLGVLNPTGTPLYPGGAPEGSNVALIFLWRMQTDGSPAGYSQELTHALLANTKYTLRVKVGNIAPIAGETYDLNGFPGYRVELLAGATVLAADNNTLQPAEGTFLQSEVTFTTGSAHPELGQKLTIRLINLNKKDSGIEVNYDDVELEAAPSP